MQKTKASIWLVLFSFSATFLSSTAIAQPANALPPIISFILEGGNQAPVNTVSLETLELDIIDMDEFLTAPIAVSVSDADGNLSSIRITSTLGTLVAVADDSNVTLDDGDSLNDFTISGSQENLINSISTLIFSPSLSGPGNYTITVLSTDTEGATDEDIINIIVTDSTPPES